ncbi:hypothetical protein [Colwellia sp. MEBiC06753]
MNKQFAVGSVGHTLMQLRGTWHDSVELFELDGSPLADDTVAGSGTPGMSPFDNIVYIDFDGENFAITNVHFRGRPAGAKTFTGKLIDGVLVFDPMGPGSYKNVGMSGGPGILTFTGAELNEATSVYMEPDFIIVTAPGHRTRHTVLYRDGIATRTLTARGVRLSPSCDKRHELDSRGLQGDVHEQPFQANIWQHLVK